MHPVASIELLYPERQVLVRHWLPGALHDIKDVTRDNDISSGLLQAPAHGPSFLPRIAHILIIGFTDGDWWANRLTWSIWLPLQDYESWNMR